MSDLNDEKIHLFEDPTSEERYASEQRVAYDNGLPIVTYESWLRAKAHENLGLIDPDPPKQNNSPFQEENWQDRVGNSTGINPENIRRSTLYSGR